MMINELMVMLEDGAVNPCPGFTPVRRSGPPKTLSAARLKQVGRCARKHGLTLKLLSGPKTGLSPEVIDALGDADRFWLAPPDVPLPPNEAVATVLDLPCYKNSRVIAGVCVLKFVREDIPRLAETAAGLANDGVSRVRLVPDDLLSFREEDVKLYGEALRDVADRLVEPMVEGRCLEVDVLTDRLFLDKMGNCAAGEFHLTIGPDGKTYPCPAFYYAGNSEWPVGDVLKGSVAETVAKHFSLERATLCHACDAYHCRRCVYLNLVKTGEPSVPPGVACLLAHEQRRATQYLVRRLAEHGVQTAVLRPVLDLRYPNPLEYCRKEGFPVPGSLVNLYAANGGGIEIPQLLSMCQRLELRVDALEKELSLMRQE